jgi:hypothetical protein
MQNLMICIHVREQTFEKCSERLVFVRFGQMFEQLNRPTPSPSGNPRSHSNTSKVESVIRRAASCMFAAGVIS